MFQFITAITGKRDTERDEHRAAVAALKAKGLTDEQAFAQLFVDDAAEEAITEIKVGKRGAILLTRMALAMSLPHQIGYFLSISKPHFEADPLQWVHPLSIISGALLGPFIVDLAIMYFVRYLVMKVAATSSKVWALVKLIFPVSASAYINFAVPAPHPILNYLFGGAVLFIPLVLGYQVLFKVNFGQLLQLRKETLAQVAPLATEPAIDQAAIARRAEINAKSQATKAERRAEREAQAAEEAKEKAAKAEERRQKRAASKVAELAPQSSYPAVVLSAADKEALKGLMAEAGA